MYAGRTEGWIRGVKPAKGNVILLRTGTVYVAGIYVGCDDEWYYLANSSRLEPRIKVVRKNIRTKEVLKYTRWKHE